MIDITGFEIIKNALIIGTIISIVASIVGYFVVIRGLSFAAHALSHIGFAGATGALLIGMNPLNGLLVFTIISAAIMGYLGDKAKGRDIATGIVLSFALGLGALFLSLYTKYASQAFSILFGTINAVSVAQIIETLILALLSIIAIIFIYKPLLLSSLDPEVALAKGLPVRLLSVIFFVILAVTVAISFQIVGILLIFTLVLGPAASAQYFTDKPINTILLSIFIGIFITWSGIIFAYYINWPVSFFISTLAFIFYLTGRIYNMNSK